MQVIIYFFYLIIANLIGAAKLEFKNGSFSEESEYFSTTLRENLKNPSKFGKRVDVFNEVTCKNTSLTILTSLMEFFKIILNEEHVENIKVCTKMEKLNNNRLYKLHFIILLNMREFHEIYEGKKTEKLLVSGDPTVSNQIKKQFPFLKRFEKYEIESVERTTVGSSQAKKSKLRIRLKFELSQNQDKNLELQSEKRPSSSKSKKKNLLKVKKFTNDNIVIGFLLALLSSILCGLSFALKKWSLLRMDKAQSYYCDKQWWMAHTLMMVGDILHFIAFFFAPAIIVCTLQILTVLVTAVTSSKILGETLNKFGNLAFMLCLGGCWVIVFHAPNEPHIYNIDTLLYWVSSHIFLTYMAFLGIVIVLFHFYWIPKYAELNSLVYTIQSAIFGSIIVINMKGVILMYTDTLFHWLPWTCLAVVIIFVLLQLKYLNKALSIYNALVVTTHYYVLYIACVIIASSLLFKFWETSRTETIFTNFCGMLTTALGAIILTIFEEENATFDFSRLLRDQN